MSVEIRPVSTRRELSTFIKLPWRIYRNEPKWVAPLLMDVKKRLDQDKNPFFKHAQAQYFLAYRDGQPVGRDQRAHRSELQRVSGQRVGPVWVV